MEKRLRDDVLAGRAVLPATEDRYLPLLPHELTERGDVVVPPSYGPEIIKECVVLGKHWIATIHKDAENPDQECFTEVGPVYEGWKHHANSLGNVTRSLAERLDKKRNPMRLSPAQCKTLKATADAFWKKALTRERMQRYVDEHPSYRELFSPKWSEDRKAAALKQLLDQGAINTEIRWTLQIKSEVGGSEKAPRIVCSSGDTGQLQMLATLAMVEWCVLEEYGCHSIKGQRKDLSLVAISQKSMELSKQYGQIECCQNDLSSFDWTINDDICGLVEIPGLSTAVSFLQEQAVVFGGPATWCDENLKQRRKKDRLATYTKAHAFAVIHLPMCRMSGDRGTSILNFVDNLLVSTAAALDDPVSWVEHHDEPIHQVCGFREIYYPYAEGDDFLGLHSVGTRRPALEREKYWRQIGCTPKLTYLAEGVIVFVGNSAWTTPEGIRPYWLPQVARNLLNGSIIRQDLRKLTGEALKRRVGEHCAALMVRAANYRFYPPLRDYFRALAASLGTRYDTAARHYVLSLADKYCWLGGANYESIEELADLFMDVPCDCGDACWITSRMILQHEMGDAPSRDQECLLMSMPPLLPGPNNFFAAAGLLPDTWRH